MTLYSAIKIIVFKDTQKFRNSVYLTIKEDKRLIKIIENIYLAVPTWLKLIMIRCYAIGCFGNFSSVKKTDCNTISYTAYKNEKRQIDFIENIIKKRILNNQRKLSIHNYFTNYKLLLFLIFSPRISKIFKYLIKQYSFLVVCRSTELITLYVKFSKDLKESHQVQNIIVSSDSNPYALASVLAGYKHNKKTFYINHGFIPPNPPRLITDFSILDSEKLFEMYQHHKKNRSKLIFKGVEGLSRNGQIVLPQQINQIGIFLSLVTNWGELYLLIEKLQKKYKVLVRLHPNLIIRKKSEVEKLRLLNLKLSYANEVATEDVKKCDLVIAGNSSVHLTVLKFKTPSLYYNQIDNVPDDFYYFIKNGLTYHLENPDDLDISKVQSFYNDDWYKNTYLKYDPQINQDIIRRAFNA